MSCQSHSSSLRRRLRVPTRRNTAPATMAPLLEGTPEPTFEMTAIATKPKSIRSKRRRGVSDIHVPPPQLLTLDEASNWRLTVALNDEKDVATSAYDFPSSPSVGSHGYESSDESSSSDSHSSHSSLATTPAPSPTPEVDAALTHWRTSVPVRWKTIRPLTITKRSTSLVPPGSLSTETSAARPPTRSASLDFAVDEVEEEDDNDFYATYARDFITLPRHSGVSCVSPCAARRANRESAVIPVSARPHSLPSPFDTSHWPSSSSTSTPASPSSALKQRAHISNFSRPASLVLRRPPSVPIDAHESVCSEDFASYYLSSPSSTGALFLLPDSRYPSSTCVSSTCTSTSRSKPSSSTASPHSRPAALLSPPPGRDAVEAPLDVDADETEWEDVSECMEDVPVVILSLDPKEPSHPADASPQGAQLYPPERDRPLPPVPPLVQPYTGWHPRPRASQLRSALAPFFASPSPSPSPSGQTDPPTHTEPRTPVLRSKWSSHTLSSVRAGPRSPVRLRSPASSKTFAFARRYLPRAKAQAPSSPESAPEKPSRTSPPKSKSKPKPKPMGGAVAIYPSTRVLKDDAPVVGRPPVPASVLAYSAAPPDVFASAWPFSAQWASTTAVRRD
ncbi:hypothetical protein GGX14DRAFT_471217 [Mycena pura]|uniref:Uncharacterized protein n=1 Tax=Mycena pura TaxID=153505 RepID=A0AAD6Y240_9AGAR|nr:hypothetical protein GGX14DRAFT_471217 [Mycena pura]